MSGEERNLKLQRYMESALTCEFSTVDIHSDYNNLSPPLIRLILTKWGILKEVNKKKKNQSN